MSLQPSTRLGPYEIISSIGAGGMGEVHRARDTQLDRIVAVKVLPEHLSSNPQLHERFEREARAISSPEPSAYLPAVRRRPSRRNRLPCDTSRAKPSPPGSRKGRSRWSRCCSTPFRLRTP